MSRTIVKRPPSALEKSIPMIREVALPLNGLQPGSRAFRMGKAKIFLSPPYQEAGMGWHMSISREDRYPSWDEVVAAWYSLVPDAENREGVMHLPPLRDYINVHDHCFQVHELMP